MGRDEIGNRRELARTRLLYDGALSAERSASETVLIPRQGRRPVLYPGVANDRGVKTWSRLQKVVKERARHRSAAA